MPTLLLGLGCLSIAIFAGLLGIGGGFVLVPFLMDGMGFEVRPALGISALSGLVIAAVASISRMRHGELRKLIDWRQAFALGGGCGLFAFIGAQSVQHVDLKLIRFLFILLLIWLVYRTIKSVWFGGPLRSLPKKTVSRVRRRVYFSLGVPLAGLMAGMLSIGGGVFFVPLLFTFLGKSIHSASATSGAAVFFTSIGSVLGHTGNIKLASNQSLAVVSGSVLVGGWLGGRFGYLVPERGLTILTLVLQISVLLLHAFKLFDR